MDLCSYNDHRLGTRRGHSDMSTHLRDSRIGKRERSDKSETRTFRG